MAEKEKNMIKKLFGILITLGMLLSLLPFTLTANAAGEVIELSTADDILALMNGGDMSASYRLKNDINLADYTGELTQRPIGRTADDAFCGRFDGNGYEIRGVDISISEGRNVAFFGFLLDGVIENLALRGTVCSTAAEGQVSGFVGGTNGGVIRNCKNYIDVSGTRYVGGFVGFYAVAADKTLEVTECCNYGNITGTGNAIGGILGMGNTTGIVKVTYCCNEGAVTTNAQYVGGIVGYFNRAETAKTDSELAYCWNKGTVRGTKNARSDVGGIAGYIMKSYNVHDCLNTGALYSVYGNYIGGIACTLNGGAKSPANCLNRGPIYTGSSASESATATYIGDVVGYPATKACSNCFYQHDGAYASTHSNTFGGTVQGSEYAEAKFSTLNSNGAWMIAAKPELSFFHVHVPTTFDPKDNDCHRSYCYCGELITADAPHEYDNNVCLVCGWEKKECTHPSAHDEILKAATCVETGLKNTVCDDCGLNLEIDVVIPINPENHADVVLTPAYDAERDCIVFSTACCGTAVFDDNHKLTDIYVGGAGAADPTIGNTFVAGTKDAPFATFAVAMQYAASQAEYNNTDVTVYVLDTVNIGANYHSPKTEHMITVTGAALNFIASPRRFYAEGPITFEALTFTTNVTDGLKIFAQNHKMVFGEGIRMGNADTISSGDGYPAVNSVKAYVFGGFENRGIPADGMNTDLTVRSGDYWFIGGWNSSGDMYPTAGVGKLTVGKVNPDDYLFTNYLVAFSTGPQRLNAASKVEVTIDGDLDVHWFYYGTQNDIASSRDMLYETDLFLRGKLNSVATADMNKLNITGTMTAENTVLNVYYDTRVESALQDKTLFDITDVNYDVSLTYLKTVLTVDTYAKYCLDYLDGHKDTDGDDLCDACGSSVTCAHADTYDIIIAEPDCSHTGSKKVICSDCSVLVEIAEIAKAPDNHVLGGKKYVYDTTAEEWILKCTACDLVYGRGGAGALTVYVDYTAADDDGNLGLTPGTALHSIEEAIMRIGDNNATIVLTSDYSFKDHTTFPEHKGTVTFTSIADSQGEPAFGFRTEMHGLRLHLNGPTRFENFVFESATTDRLTASGTSYYVLVMYGNYNDVEFGEGLITYGRSFFVVGGNCDSQSPIEQRTVTVTFNSTDAREMVTPSGTPVEAVPFFGRIYCFDRYSSNGFVTENKNVTINLVNNEVGSIYVSAVGDLPTDYPEIPMENCHLTIQASGDKQVVKQVSNGVQWNTTSYLDSLTWNMADNARVLSASTIYHVKKLNLHISSFLEGRTDQTARMTFTNLNGSGIFGSEGAVYTHGKHSVDGNMGFGSPERVDETVIDDCIFDEGVFTMTDKNTAKRVYTCEICGETKTEDLTVGITGSADVKIVELGRGAFAFLGAISSLDYKEIGFEINIDGVTRILTDVKAYKNIKAGGVEFTSEDFGIENGYVFGIKVTGVPAHNSMHAMKILLGGKK